MSDPYENEFVFKGGEIFSKRNNLDASRVWMYWGLFLLENDQSYVVTKIEDRPPRATSKLLTSFFAPGKYTALDKAKAFIGEQERKDKNGDQSP